MEWWLVMIPWSFSDPLTVSSLPASQRRKVVSMLACLTNSSTLSSIFKWVLHSCSTHLNDGIRVEKQLQVLIGVILLDLRERETIVSLHGQVAMISVRLELHINNLDNRESVQEIDPEQVFPFWIVPAASFFLPRILSAPWNILWICVIGVHLQSWHQITSHPKPSSFRGYRCRFLLSVVGT